MKPLRILDSGTLVAVLAAAVLVTGCGGAGSSSSGPGTPPGPLSVSLSTSTVVAPQDGTPGAVDVTVSGANTGSSVSVAASNLPSGVTSQFAPAAGGLHGALSLVAGRTAPAGTYSASVVVTNGTQTASQSFVLVIADRKSTRLNSSHLVISYAVFCLTKKDTNNDAAPPCRNTELLWSWHRRPPPPRLLLEHALSPLDFPARYAAPNPLAAPRSISLATS